MLATSSAILTPTSLGGGQYQFSLFINPSVKAKHLNVGDYIQDALGNEYSIVSFTSPFSDGGIVVSDFVTTDILPNEDSDYDSVWYTPGQDDLRTDVQTDGGISSQSIYDAVEYEYTLTASWSSSQQANAAEAGDRIVDSNGVEFEITFVDGVSRFSVPFRAKEVERVGQAPTVGSATLYRPTGSYGFYQGVGLGVEALNSIRNRDNSLIENNMNTGAGPSIPQAKRMVNQSGALIPSGKMVSKKSDGSIVVADSDSLDGQQPIGVTSETIADSSDGLVITFGPNIPGILTGLGFAPGDTIYVSENASLTNDGGSFTGDDDSIIKVGIADCAEGVVSGSATDMILWREIVYRS